MTGQTTLQSPQKVSHPLPSISVVLRVCGHFLLAPIRNHRWEMRLVSGLSQACIEPYACTWPYLLDPQEHVGPFHSPLSLPFSFLGQPPIGSSGYCLTAGCHLFLSHVLGPGLPCRANCISSNNARGWGFCGGSTAILRPPSVVAWLLGFQATTKRGRKGWDLSQVKCHKAHFPSWDSGVFLS